MPTPLPDQRFLAIRSLIVELAAALDRTERHATSDDAALAADARWQAVRDAVSRLTGGPGRAEDVQQMFSDPYDPRWRQDGGPLLSGSAGCCGR